MRRRHGGDSDTAIDLSASLNPNGPPETVRKKIRESASEIRGYPYESRRRLNQILARKYNLSNSEVLIDSGIGGVISLLTELCRGKSIGTLVPTFTEYEDLLGSVATNVETQTLSFSPSGIIEPSLNFDLSNLDYLILCNPNNPTGQCIHPKTMLNFLRKCERSNTRLVVDEAYIEFTENKDRWSMVGYLDDTSNLIVMHSLTKYYGMAGLRVGYLLANESIVKKLSGRQNPWPVGYLALMGAIEALNDHSFQRQTSAWLEMERERVFSELDSLGYLQPVKSLVNYFLVRTERKLQNELRRQGIEIRSADNFTGLSEKWYRISLGTPDDNTHLLSVLKHLDSTFEGVPS